ncbi:MAG: Gfo/Idh/MocA family oxidoreductase [Bacteroidia bacterium]|nr:Gfo/Idh/MocA family oxidoreductase [Bacteroidia bacterium]
MASMKKKDNSRRKFIKQGLMASSIIIVPRHVLGGCGYTAPSDQLNLAAIACGGKGRSDIMNAAAGKSERVIALCDVHTRAKNGVSDTVKKFSKANFYQDFREMLDKEKDIDAVTIATPDHIHAPAAVRAMQQGMHVYIQKPLTHNIREARMLTEMAREKKVVTQMGNQGASNPYQVDIQEWINNGTIGKVSKVYVWTNRPVWPQGIRIPDAAPKQKPGNLNWDLWLGPAKKIPYTPGLHPFNWRGWWEYGTGALGDMGCHIIDIPFKALGLKYPTDVECSLGTVYRKMWTPEFLPESCPPSSMITLHFDPTPKNNTRLEMTWMDGGIRPPHPDLIPPDDDIGGPGSYNGILIIGEKGIISSDEKARSVKLYLEGEEPLELPRVNSEPEYGHHQQWIKACRAGYDSPEHKALTSSFDYAGPLTETVLMGNLAIRSYNLVKEGKKGQREFYGRKKLLWDGDQMRITNLEEANQFVRREYRPGWEI